MATKIECDRCHKPVKGEVHLRGFAIQREYCDRCVKKVDKLLEAIDDLHDALALKWETDLALLRKQHNIHGGLLPDVSV